MLIDSYGRKIDYLRISLIDRCNLRCRYCLPASGIINKPCRGLLSFEEIITIVGATVQLGIKNIRLTGGEPLLRKGLKEVFKPKFSLLKINVLLLDEISALEVSDFLQWTMQSPVHIRFLEFIPINSFYKTVSFVSAGEVLKIAARFREMEEDYATPRRSAAVLRQAGVAPPRRSTLTTPSSSRLAYGLNSGFQSAHYLLMTQ